MTSSRQGPEYQDTRAGSCEGHAKFSPVSPEQGTYSISPSLNPACLRKAPNLVTISWNRS